MNHEQKETEPGKRRNELSRVASDGRDDDDDELKFFNVILVQKQIDDNKAWIQDARKARKFKKILLCD